ncbi:RDD family protein [Actinocrinis puniceicyclus]
MPPLADWWQRVGAFALDNGPFIVAGSLTGATQVESVDILFGVLAFLGLIWAVGNSIRAGRTGQSYGKQTLGLRLARFENGLPVGAAVGFLRLFLDWLFWVACAIPGVLNLLWPLWDSKHQTWADKIVRSVVVRTR